jgi:hypothetical protein
MRAMEKSEGEEREKEKERERESACTRSMPQ